MKEWMRSVVRKKNNSNARHATSCLKNIDMPIEELTMCETQFITRENLGFWKSRVLNEKSTHRPTRTQTHSMHATAFLTNNKA